MPRKLRRPKVRTQAGVTEVEEYALMYGDLPERNPDGSYALAGNVWAAFDLCYPSGDRLDTFRTLWSLAREGVMASWIADQPGTRPFAFWLLEAPEPRRHVRGCGRPDPEGTYPHDLARRRGILPFTDVDPNDPPFVESEAAYLRRHGLLTAGEDLPAECFEPVLVEADDEDDGEG